MKMIYKADVTYTTIYASQSRSCGLLPCVYCWGYSSGAAGQSGPRGLSGKSARQQRHGEMKL